MSRPTKTELYERILAARNIAPKGSCFRHQKSGDLYEVVLFSVREEDGETLISYSDGLVSFTRPFAEFFEIVELEGGPGPRFVPVPWQEGRRS